MIDYDHKEVSKEQAKQWVFAHLMESPRERMDTIERWLKCSVDQRIEVYGKNKNSVGCYIISGEFLRYERDVPKDSNNVDDPFDPLNLTMFVDQGETERAIRFADTSNLELIGQVKNYGGEIVYRHTDQMKRMKDSLKQKDSNKKL